MSNPNPNESTRFQNGNTPKPPGASANRPWSIRNAIRREVARKNKDGIANAEAIAKAMVKHAIEGDVRAAEVLIEQVDGKVAQPNLNLDLAAIQNMSEEDLLAIVNGTHPLTSQGAGSAGAEEEAGDTAEQPAADPQADSDSPSVRVSEGEVPL